MNKRLNVEGYSPRIDGGKDLIKINFTTVMTMEEFKKFSDLIHQGTVDVELK